MREGCCDNGFISEMGLDCVGTGNGLGSRDGTGCSAGGGGGGVLVLIWTIP